MSAHSSVHSCLNFVYVHTGGVALEMSHSPLLG
jgi:hypothetical protein